MKKAIVWLVVVGVLAGLWFGRKWWMPIPGGDYSRPGRAGAPVPGNIDHDTTVTINPRGNSFTDTALTDLACGTPYKILTTASETANCERVNYSRLRDRAQLATATRLGQLTCEQGCGPKRVRTLFAKYECNGHRATVSVKTEVVCPRPGEAGPTDSVSIPNMPVNRSSETAVGGEDGNMTPPDRRSELITDLTTGSTTFPILKCPETLTYAFRYAEHEPGRCASFADYPPFVTRAEGRARTLYYDPQACVGGCTKSPFTPIREEWDCDAAASQVVVKVWFKVECKQ